MLWEGASRKVGCTAVGAASACLADPQPLGSQLCKADQVQQELGCLEQYPRCSPLLLLLLG